MNYPAYFKAYYKAQSVAVQEGYARLTSPYCTREARWLDNALSHLIQGRIDCCLVPTKVGELELWRKGATGPEFKKKPRSAKRYLPADDVAWLISMSQPDEQDTTTIGTGTSDAQHQQETHAPVACSPGSTRIQHNPEIAAGIDPARP